ncbi:MAG TPA: aminotransferase class V-fold PLP-dependent enzyme, partial [Clostridia bacterium]|nr:aminotransferase class V-fold PLP-dependent enzyme [Clostridia bacterium]
MIYMDNAATSFPKPDKVYDEVLRCMKEYCANPGRSGHVLSVASGKAIFEAREKISSFLNIKNPLRLCFTKNATESLNMAIKGILLPGDHVIATSMEHNSVIRPLKTLEKDSDIEITIVRGNSSGEIDPDDIKRQIQDNTSLIICTLSSNVNGMIMPVKEIGSIARQNGIPFLVDASQGIGSVEVDTDEMNIDLLAFSGHKGLMGPQGTGGLYIREGIDIRPLIQGGTGSDSQNVYQPEYLPDMFESGTLNTPGIIGLKAGVDFITFLGRNEIRTYKHMLIERLDDGLREIGGITFYHFREMSKNSGIIAINLENRSSTEVSSILNNKYGIAVRSGLHCSPIAHETMGTLESGIIRLSPGCFTTLEEVDLVINAFRSLKYS